MCTAAGNFFHACLEKMDLQAPDTWQALVQQQLALHGIDGAQFADTALSTLRTAVESPLWPGGPHLSGQKAGTLLREVEFYFPVKRLRVRGIARAFEDCGDDWAALAPVVAALSAHDIDGYMKGYIDLVFSHAGCFHILDWKSNWLGPSPDAYGPDALASAMRAHRYFLQYCFYAVALDKYLALRIPDYNYERHFGGACYVFLRGLDPDRPGWGVVQARPPQALVNALGQALDAARMEIQETVTV